MPQWSSPLNATLRRCAGVGGAFEKGLNDIASRESALAVLNPLEWLSLAEGIFTALWNTPARSSPAPSAPAPSATARSAGVPLAHVIPANAIPITRTSQSQYTPGWGANPFQPPPTKPSPAPAQAAGLSVSAADLQAVIDQDALFWFYSQPDMSNRSEGIGYYDEKGERQVIGFHLSNDLHRFNVMVSAPTNRAPLASRDKLGEIAGTSTWRWMFKPDGFGGDQRSDPPPVPMDPDAEQEFAMLDGLFRMGDGEDGFHATGAGRTYPAMIRGRKELHVSAIGALTDGFGKFAGREPGVFVYSGTITAAGFRGALILRVGDVPGTLQTSQPLPELRRVKTSEYGVRWLTLRAEAIPSTLAVPLPADSPQPGVVCRQDLRLIDMDFCTRGSDGLRSTIAVRQVIGAVTSEMTFDPAVGRGTVADPMPFATRCQFSFTDFLGKPIGGFTTESVDGRAFFTDLGGVGGIRFASIGQVVAGTDRFEGMKALVAENTFAALEPYAGSSVFTLRVEDPDDRFFAHAGVWRDISVSEIGEEKKDEELQPRETGRDR